MKWMLNGMQEVLLNAGWNVKIWSYPVLNLWHYVLELVANAFVDGEKDAMMARDSTVSVFFVINGFL